MNAKPEALKSCRIEVRWIAPEEAKRLYDATAEAGANFRKTKQSWVRYLTKQYLSGEWMASPMPIVLGKNGLVLDGMHRLATVADVGVGQWFIFVSNWPDTEDLAIDNNQTRSAGQVVAARHRDWDWPDNNNKRATVVATINAMRSSWGMSARVTAKELEQAYEAHRPAFDFVFSIAGSHTSRVAPSGSRAAFVRAWIAGCAEHELRSAWSLMTKGIREDGLQEARNATMLTVLRFLGQSRASGGSQWRQESYGKTANALHNYIEGNAFTKLYMPQEDPFPVPEWDARAA